MAFMGARSNQFWQARYLPRPMEKNADTGIVNLPTLWDIAVLSSESTTPLQWPNLVQISQRAFYTDYRKLTKGAVQNFHLHVLARCSVGGW